MCASVRDVRDAWQWQLFVVVVVFVASLYARHGKASKKVCR